MKSGSSSSSSTSWRDSVERGAQIGIDTDRQTHKQIDREADGRIEETKRRALLVAIDNARVEFHGFRREVEARRLLTFEKFFLHFLVAFCFHPHFTGLTFYSFFQTQSPRRTGGLAGWLAGWLTSRRAARALVKSLSASTRCTHVPSSSFFAVVIRMIRNEWKVTSRRRMRQVH